MSADDDSDLELDGDERKFRLFWRVVVFLLINGPTTVLAVGLWIRVGAHSSQHASGGGSSWLMLAFVVWLVGLVGSAFAIFKK